VLVVGQDVMDVDLQATESLLPSLEQLREDLVFSLVVAGERVPPGDVEHHVVGEAFGDGADVPGDHGIHEAADHLLVRVGHESQRGTFERTMIRGSVISSMAYRSPSRP
jgi:hypothetical protein